MEVTKDNIKVNEIYYAVQIGYVYKIKVVKLGDVHEFKELKKVSPLFDYIDFSDPDYVFKDCHIEDRTSSQFNKMFTTKEEADAVVNDARYKSRLKEYQKMCDEMSRDLDRYLDEEGY